MKLTVVGFLPVLIATSISLSCSSPTKTSNDVNTSNFQNTTPTPALFSQPTVSPSQGSANKTAKAQNVNRVDIAGVPVSVGQDAYISQDRLERYLMKTEGNTDTYAYRGSTYLITYGPGERGAYFVKSIKVMK
jgi:hypothetical protein